MLVMSELACYHESLAHDIIEILVNNIGVDLNSAQGTLVEAAILGLHNIGEYSPSHFKTILNRMASSVIVNDGDILCMHYLTDLLREREPARAPELCKKYSPLVSSSRETNSKKIHALRLCGSK